MIIITIPKLHAKFKFDLKKGYLRLIVDLNITLSTFNNFLCKNSQKSCHQKILIHFHNILQLDKLKSIEMTKLVWSMKKFVKKLWIIGKLRKIENVKQSECFINVNFIKKTRRGYKINI